MLPAAGLSRGAALCNLQCRAAQSCAAVWGFHRTPDSPNTPPNRNSQTITRTSPPPHLPRRHACAQNVADHLSSRAYMELTSRFPARHRRELMQGGVLSTGDLDGGADGASTGDGGWTSREDSVDWEAVRTASHADLSDAIKCRGMQFRQDVPSAHRAQHGSAGPELHACS